MITSDARCRPMHELNPGFPRQKQCSVRGGLFHQYIGLKFKDETSTQVLYLECSSIWY
jgi:hypothetical protein